MNYSEQLQAQVAHKTVCDVVRTLVDADHLRVIRKPTQKPPYAIFATPDGAEMLRDIGYGEALHPFSEKASVTLGQRYELNNFTVMVQAGNYHYNDNKYVDGLCRDINEADLTDALKDAKSLVQREHTANRSPGG